MKYLAFALLLFAAGCASSGRPATRIAEPDIASAYLPLHGRVHLGLDSANAAAVVIAPGVAVTNIHNDNLVDPKTVIGFATVSDLMFFRTKRNAAPLTAIPVLGARVTAYGQGGDGELRVAHGVVCNIVHVPGYSDSPYFMFAGDAGPGFSGGPVLDSSGKLIGITAKFVDRAKNKRLMFAYDMARVWAEFQLKTPQKSKDADAPNAPAPQDGNC